MATLDAPWHNPVEFDRPADRAREDAETAYAAVRAQAGKIHPDEAKRQIARVYRETKSKLDQMAADVPRSRTADIGAAKRAAFGIDDVTRSMSPDAAVAASMSFRDAQARVANITNPSEAQALLEQAEQSGDELLARAVGNHALHWGMHDVATSYLDNRPDKQAALDHIEQLQQRYNPRSTVNMFEHACPTPSELNGLSDTQISQLADS